MSIKRIALCTGEPAGIGPDLAILLCAHSFDAEIITLGCPNLLLERANELGKKIALETFNPAQVARKNTHGVIRVLPIKTLKQVTTGKLDTANAPYVLNILDTAIAGIKDGIFSAMVTNPVQKSVLNDAGISFSGHTEYLADQTHTDQVVMMLASDNLRVTLATTHLPLREVADNINEQSLTRTIKIIDAALKKYFGVSQPHILVAGLNPHAGEGGHLGKEEIEIIEPCINKLKEQGFNLTGPLPADTLFTDKYLEDADAVLAMYHDQGLPVLKYQGFGKSCNITLGLPIIRTSVDHGTALDLAGTGNINTGSLKTAISNAIIMANHKHT